MYFGLETLILVFGLTSAARRHCLRSVAFRFLGTANDYLGSDKSKALASQNARRAQTKNPFTHMARWFLAEPSVN